MQEQFHRDRTKEGPVLRWFIYNFGLMGSGTHCFPYQWVQLQTYESRTLFLMTSPLGTRWNKNFASQRQNYAQKMQDAQVTKSLVLLFCLSAKLFLANPTNFLWAGLFIEWWSTEVTLQVVMLPTIKNNKSLLWRYFSWYSNTQILLTLNKLTDKIACSFVFHTY